MKIYRHKLTSERLTIKKDYGSVSSCYCETYKLWGHKTHNVVIVMNESLIEVKEETQQKLF